MDAFFLEKKSVKSWCADDFQGGCSGTGTCLRVWGALRWWEEFEFFWCDPRWKVLGMLGIRRGVWEGGVSVLQVCPGFWGPPRWERRLRWGARWSAGPWKPWEPWETKLSWHISNIMLLKYSDIQSIFKHFYHCCVFYLIFVWYNNFKRVFKLPSESGMNIVPFWNKCSCRLRHDLHMWKEFLFWKYAGVFFFFLLFLFSFLFFFFFLFVLFFFFFLFLFP